VDARRRPCIATFMVRHSSTPHHPSAVSSMNLITRSADTQFLSTKSVKTCNSTRPAPLEGKSPTLTGYVAILTCPGYNPDS
jgi:hypothetical protein